MSRIFLLVSTGTCIEAFVSYGIVVIILTFFMGNNLKTYFNESIGTDVTATLPTNAFHDTGAAREMDYIQANYVNGFKLKRKFIATQAPTPGTIVDFLEMIWQNGCQIIVVLTQIFENNQHEIEPYWPMTLGSQMRGKYMLITSRIDSKDDYKKYYLEIDNTTVEKRCSISLYHYTNWPEFGVPVDFPRFLKFLMAVNADSLERYFTPPHMGPIVVHGNAIIGRTGIFCALDICLEERLEMGKTNVVEVVRRISNECYLNLLTAHQYAFIHSALEKLDEWGILLKY